MPKYTCSKCGETCFSKDPVRRNVFPSDQMASIMTNITNVVTTLQDNGRRMVVIEFPWSDTDQDETDEVLELRCVEIIRALSDDNVRHWLCDHHWLGPDDQD